MKLKWKVISKLRVCIQELIASLPQPSDQSWEMTVDRGAQLAAESTDASSNHDDSPMGPPLGPENEEVPPASVNEDGSTTVVNEPSASEEQLQEAVKEQKWLISCTSAHTDVSTLHMVLTFIQTLWYTHAPRPVPVD